MFKEQKNRRFSVIENFELHYRIFTMGYYNWISLLDVLHVCFYTNKHTQNTIYEIECPI